MKMFKIIYTLVENIDFENKKIKNKSNILTEIFDENYRFHCFDIKDINDYESPTYFKFPDTINLDQDVFYMGPLNYMILSVVEV